MKIGIWCGYGKTLTPSAGIGVFTHNLARALARQPAVEQVVLAVHRGDAPLVEETLAAGQGRVGIVDIPRESWWRRWRRKRLIREHRRLSDVLADPARLAVRGGVEPLERRREEVEQAVIRLASAHDPTPVERFAGCDVWLLPHVAVHRRFSAASVVVVHDMVPLRYSGVIRTRDLESFRRRSITLTQEATLVACMSHVICDEDIVGVLGCPRERVRVVLPAVPEDFGQPCPSEQVRSRWPWARGRFILYPADFRSYKNHEGLVEALRLLRAGGDDDTHLVFTGGKSLPGSLRRQIAAAGLSAVVHVIGRVERATLARLYGEAAATIVPSFYEQGSFPLLEAMHWGCPVAASDIPALREAFAPMGEAMLFFDPRRPEAIAGTMKRLCAEGTAIRDRQAIAFRAITSRRWDDAAAEWIGVFQEAVALHAGRGHQAAARR